MHWVAVVEDESGTFSAFPAAFDKTNPRIIDAIKISGRNISPIPSTVSKYGSAYFYNNTNSRKLVRDSVGNLYFAYAKEGQIFVAKSSDNGQIWKDMGGAPIQFISASALMQENPSIAIDSQDNLHVVWAGNDLNSWAKQIKYSKYSGEKWSVWTNIQIIPEKYQLFPSIAIDSKDNLHVVWSGEDNENYDYQIKYSKYSGGKWSIWTNIQVIPRYAQYPSSIAIDSQNNLHIVWEGKDQENYNYPYNDV